MVRSLLSTDTYPLIEDHAIIGDLKTAALVEKTGTINFLCFPTFDAPSVFAALLDQKKGGHFKLHPDSQQTSYKQFYMPDTNVLITRFLTPEGIAEITDIMPLDGEKAGNRLVRRVAGITGEVKFQMECSPAFHYGQHPHKITQASDHELLFVEEQAHGLSLRLVSSEPLQQEKKRGTATFTLKAGKQAVFVLENDTSPVIHEQIQQFAQDMFQETLSYWRNWISQCTYRGNWQAEVHRSALTLKLLISHEHGSMVAAPTFSLPEQLGGSLNWDYRYTWIRDASFSMHALIHLGFKKEAEHFIRWIEKICAHLHDKNDTLSIMYRQDGTQNLQEQTLDHLEGYCQSSPVRIGNQAYQQEQLDVYGELMNAVYLYDKFCEPISHRLWTYIQRLIDWLTDHWQEKDQGLWEERGKSQSFLYSRLMEWVALERSVELAQKHSFPLPTRWIKVRDQLFKNIYKNFWDEQQQAFVKEEGKDTLDASVLLMPIMRIISGKDPQWLSTLQKMEEVLASDVLVLRYLPKPGKEEGTFTACGFWYIECLARSGQTDKARLYFDKMLAYGNHVGLYSEEISLQGRQQGNFPQALSHLTLISTALYLNEPA